jgi:hypothetical protein
MIKKKLSEHSLVGYAVLDMDLCVCAYCWNPDEWSGDIVEISKDFAPVMEDIYFNVTQWCYHCDDDVKYWGVLQRGSNLS